MMDCKSMTNPMVTNLGKLKYFELDLVDPSMYSKINNSPMHLVNVRLDISFVMNTLS